MITTHVKAASLAFLAAGAVTTGFVVTAAQITPLERETSVGPAKSTELLLAYQPGGGMPPPAKPLDPSNMEARPEGRTRSSAAKTGGHPAPKPGTPAAMAVAMEGGADDDAEYQFRNRIRIVQLAAVVAAAEAEGQPNSKNQALLKELDQPWEMAFSAPTPLSEVFKYIKSTLKKSGRPPLPIYVDPRAMANEGLTMDSPVVMDLEGVPLKTALRLLLKQHGLAYCVRDGVVIVSSPDGIREELTEAASELYSSEAGQLGQILQSMQKERAMQ